MLNEEPSVQSFAEAVDAPDSCEVVPVHPDKVLMVWDRIVPWLEKAMEHGDRLYAPEDVLKSISEQHFILWVAVKGNDVIGMAITSLDAYPQMTIATIRWAGGDPHVGKFWLHEMIEELKRWGRHFGASKLAGAGRKGWLRGNYGFRESGVLFQQDV